jgi:transcription-repair coupling factor (superfamily II helicase)
LDHQELGAGFAVASADLEQRGAGSILGAKQHGHIDAVGFETYLALFEEAIATARGELSKDRIDPEIKVHAPAYIPEDYLPEMEDRLREYQLLSRSETPAEVRSAVDRLEDRLGPAPKPLVNLSWMLQLRLRCRALAISHIHWLQVRVLFERVEGSPLTDAHVDDRAAEMPARLRRLEDGKIEVRFTEEEAEYPFRFLHWVLRLFESQVLPEG